MTDIHSIIKHFCCRCLFKTNHKILFLENIVREDFEDATMFFVVKCLGCDEIAFRKEFHDYGNLWQDEDGEGEYSMSIWEFPKGLERRKEMEFISYLPYKIGLVYKEAIEAFKNDCKLLAGVGFRAVLEAVCKDNEIKGKDLEVQINNLAKTSLITTNEAERLHTIRFLGNDAVHDRSVPSEKTLLIILDIVEQLLKNLYITDRKIKFNGIETVISDYYDFKILSKRKISLLSLNEERHIKDILGKESRQVKSKFHEFEGELIREIKSGKYEFLKLGVRKVLDGGKEEYQHFVVINIPVLDFAGE